MAFESREGIRHAREARSSSVPFLGTAVMAVSLLPLLMSCENSSNTLMRELAYDLDHASDEPLTVIDYLPQDGAPGVPKNIQPYYFFNKSLEGEESVDLALVAVTGSHIPFDKYLDFDSAGITFVPMTTVPDIDGYDRYDMTLERTVDADILESSEFFTEFPEGPIFNMSVGLHCETFGGSSVHAALLNSIFIPGEYPLWLMVVEGLNSSGSFPDTINLMLGPAYIRSDGTYRIYRHIGLSTLFNYVRVDNDGSFETHLDGAFLPFDTPEKVILTYLVDLTFKGTFDMSSSPARINNLELKGVLPTRSLLMLAEESESYETPVDMVELDVDLNGNGINDSATLFVTANPEQIEESSWNP